MGEGGGRKGKGVIKERAIELLPGLKMCMQTSVILTQNDLFLGARCDRSNEQFFMFLLLCTSLSQPLSPSFSFSHFLYMYMHNQPGFESNVENTFMHVWFPVVTGINQHT